eukprot:93715_1
MSLASIIGIFSYTVSIVVILWICFQCKYFVLNSKFQQHQAFRIRGKRSFILTAIILILNFIFRPVLFSFAVMDFIKLNAIWRLIIDIFQMSLYAIIEFRCWTTYYSLIWSTKKVDKQWKKFMNESYNDGWFIRYHHIFGNATIVGWFFIIHGILCVTICSLVEEFKGFSPHRLIAHFFTANILLFLITIHRIYTIIAPSLRHTYSHDMLGINRELNAITFIMTITAICDSALSLFAPSIAALFYIVYQTVLITLLAVVMFYFPQKRVETLMNLEHSIKLKDKSNAVRLQYIFTDHDLYHSLIRFMLQECSVENLLFITQWFQIQRVAVDSGIDLTFNKAFHCDPSSGLQCNLLEFPSDVFVHSNNLLEASRGLYDKFVNTFDILAINISGVSRNQLDEFYAKHVEIKSVFSKSVFSIMERTTMAIKTDDTPSKNKCAEEITVKYNLFVQQLKDNKIDIQVLQEMINCYDSCVQDCWENTYDSFRRFQSTLAFKVNANYFHLQTVSPGAI